MSRCPNRPTTPCRAGWTSGQYTAPSGLAQPGIESRRTPLRSARLFLHSLNTTTTARLRPGTAHVPSHRREGIGGDARPVARGRWHDPPACHPASAIARRTSAAKVATTPHDPTTQSRRRHQISAAEHCLLRAKASVAPGSVSRPAESMLSRVLRQPTAYPVTTSSPRPDTARRLIPPERCRSLPIRGVRNLLTHCPLRQSPSVADVHLPHAPPTPDDAPRPR